MALNRFIGSGVLLLVFGSVTDFSAQQVPDFSGIWMLDTSRSEPGAGVSMHVIRQTPDALEMTIFERHQNAYVREITINPWKYTFGRFAPRRGGKDSREPQTQARWEGDSIIALKALGNNSVAWFFTLINPNELQIESLGRGITPSFDFRRSSVPRGYSVDKRLYTRAPISYDCEACEFTIEAEGFMPATPESRGMTFRLLNDSLVVATCREPACQVKNNNDIHPSVILSRGETAGLSILAKDGQWEIPLGAR